MPKKLNYPAIRAFIRVWNPIADELEEGARIDAGFDGGEFSGPANARYASYEHEKVCRQIAERFGMTGDELSLQVWVYDNEQQDRFYDSLRRV